MDIPKLGADLERALTRSLHQISAGRFVRPKEDAPFLQVAKVVPPDDAPRRLRSMSATGYGRGTGRGRKDPALHLLRPLKNTGRRADFVRYIGGRGADIKAVADQFSMTRANINGFLTNIHRDHGLGYEKDNATVKLLLPPGARWSNIWE